MSLFVCHRCHLLIVPSLLMIISPLWPHSLKVSPETRSVSQMCLVVWWQVIPGHRCSRAGMISSVQPRVALGMPSQIMAGGGEQSVHSSMFLCRCWCPSSEQLPFREGWFPGKDASWGAPAATGPKGGQGLAVKPCWSLCSTSSHPWVSVNASI